MVARENEIIDGLLARAIVVRIAAVRCGGEIEEGRVVDPKSRQVKKSGPTYFSKNADNRLRQKGHLWSRGAGALADRNVTHKPVTVSGSVILPYLRREYAVCECTHLYRAAEVLDRIRAGLLEVLADPGFAAQFADADEAAWAAGVLRSLSDYDFPKLARLLADDPDLKNVVCARLGFTEADLENMSSLMSDEWLALEELEDYFGKFDSSRRSA